MTHPLVVVLLILGTAEEDKTAEPLRAEARRGLSARDAAFETVRVRTTYQDRRRKLFRGSPMVERVQVVEAAMDTSGGPDLAKMRVKIDLLETPDPEIAAKLKEKWLRYSASSGSKGPRSISFSTSNGMPAGDVSDVAKLTWAVHPCEILGLNSWSPSYLAFRDGSTSREAGVERIGGDETIRLHWAFPPAEPGRAAYRGAYWVAPGKGFAVLRSVWECRPTPEAPWREVSRVEARDWDRIDGLWVPRKATISKHSYYTEDLGYEPQRQCAVTFEEWALNKPLADREIDLEFPVGTHVRDVTKGRANFIKGQIHD